MSAGKERRDQATVDPEPDRPLTPLIEIYEVGSTGKLLFKIRGEQGLRVDDNRLGGQRRGTFYPDIVVTGGKSPVYLLQGICGGVLIYPDKFTPTIAPGRDSGADILPVTGRSA